MKSFDLRIQERDDFCLCSVLQSVLNKYGLVLSQQEIANNLTPFKLGFCADDDRIKDFLMRKGFSYQFYWHNQTPFNERDEVLREMNENEGIVGVNSHVYLLEEFADPVVRMVNPKDGRIVSKCLYSLLQEMERINGFFGVIRYMS